MPTGSLLLVMAYFGYQTPNLPAFASGKFAREKLQDLLLGVDREEPDPRHVMGPRMLGDAGRLKAVGKHLVQGGPAAPGTGSPRPGERSSARGRCS